MSCAYNYLGESPLLLMPPVDSRHCCSNDQHIVPGLLMRLERHKPTTPKSNFFDVKHLQALLRREEACRTYQNLRQYNSHVIPIISVISMLFPFPLYNRYITLIRSIPMGSTKTKLLAPTNPPNSTKTLNTPVRFPSFWQPWGYMGVMEMKMETILIQ